MRLFVWNIADLPWVVNMQYGGSRNKMRKIIALMLQYNATAACLQEAFNPRWRTYTHTSCPAGDGRRCIMNSGLMVIHGDGRPRKTRFASFGRSVGEDCLSVKGVMSCRMRWKGARLLVVNTHLQADSLFGFHDPTAVRRSQLDDIQGFMTDCAEDNDDIILVCGDFNHNLAARHTARYLPGWKQVPCEYQCDAPCLFDSLDHAYAMCRQQIAHRQFRLVIERLPLQQCSDHNPILVHVLDRDGE